MFRISFDPQRGKFVIQILRYGLLWATVRHDEAECYFDTYIKACDHVKAIGLDLLYQDRSENQRPRYPTHI